MKGSSQEQRILLGHSFTFLHIPRCASKREGLAPFTKQRIPHKKNRLRKRRDRLTSIVIRGVPKKTCFSFKQRLLRNPWSASEFTVLNYQRLLYTGVLISPYPDQEGNKLLFLSEWREFPSAPCLAGKKNLMTDRVSMLLKSRASLICFRACFLPGWAKDLSAPRYTQFFDRWILVFWLDQYIYIYISTKHIKLSWKDTFLYFKFVKLVSPCKPFSGSTYQHL